MTYTYTPDPNTLIADGATVLAGVREYFEGRQVELGVNGAGRLVVIGTNEGGHNGVAIDLLDLLGSLGVELTASQMDEIAGRVRGGAEPVTRRLKLPVSGLGTSGLGTFCSAKREGRITVRVRSRDGCCLKG